MNGKEFLTALNNIVKEKNIDPEIVYDAMELALTAAYKKNFKSTKKYRAHDEHGEAKVGDIVKIAETRPLSATKRFRLVEITKRAEEVQ